MKNAHSMGATLEWENPGPDVSSGDPVALENCLAVAVTDIKTGESGTLAVEGGFDLPKTDGESIATGESLVWLIDDSEFYPHGAEPDGDVLIGCALAMKPADESDPTVRVKLTPVNVTRTTNTAE